MQCILLQSLLVCAMLFAWLPGMARALTPIRFAAPRTLSVSALADELAVADVDGDGHADIACGTGGNIALFFGHGDATFDAPVYVAMGRGLTQVTLKDVNGDGKPDLIADDQFADTVIVALNQGNRQFAAPQAYPVGLQPYGVIAVDLRGKGVLDLAVTNNLSNSFCILQNKGDGTFGPATYYPYGEYPARLVSGDFNRDGKQDLALSNYVSGDVDIFLGVGDGTVRYTSNTIIGDYLPQIVTADFNGDGILDLAVSVYYGGQVAILQGRGNGTFVETGRYAANIYPHLFQTADFDGDGYPDLAIPNAGTNQFTVLQNQGDGTFGPPMTVISAGDNVRTLATGDFNEDGRPDVVVGNQVSDSISIFLNATPSSKLTGVLTISPSTVVGGEDTIGVIKLSGPAPNSGVNVSLTSSLTNVIGPSHLHIPAGAKQISFALHTGVVSSAVTGTIAASAGGQVSSASLTLLPTGISSITLSPSTVKGGETSLLTVTLEEPAAAGGVSVSVTSSLPALALPAASPLTIAPGSRRGSVLINTGRPLLAITVTLTATLNGVDTKRSLTILP